MFMQQVRDTRPPRGYPLVKARGFADLLHKSNFAILSVDVTMLDFPRMPPEVRQEFYRNKVSAAMTAWCASTPISLGLAIFPLNDPTSFRCTDPATSSHLLIRYADSIDESMEMTMHEEVRRGHCLTEDPQLKSLLGHELPQLANLFSHLHVGNGAIGPCIPCLTRVKKRRGIRRECLYDFTGHIH